MKNNQEITCIICPIGCKILVQKKASIPICLGNKCKKGIDYALAEALNPQRMLTTSIRVTHGTWPLVSVKTTQPLPKHQIFQVLDEIKKRTVKAPIQIGDILIKNVAKTNIDIVATKTVEKQT